MSAGPRLGLLSALLVPDFVEQALGTGLFAGVDDTRLAPLDDLKDWMRSEGLREGEAFGRAADLLLAREREARRAAEREGRAFDLVEYELSLLDGDGDYESFGPREVGDLLRLVVEEADAIQAFSRRAYGADFSLSVGLRLPDPRRNPRLDASAVARALAGGGAPKGRRLELDGAIQVDLSAPGAPPVLEERNGVAFLPVACDDPRVGDGTLAHLSLAFPVEARGYFLLTFEALARDLSLAGRGGGA